MIPPHRFTRGLWAVALESRPDAPRFLGANWDSLRKDHYVGEPPRMLLFRTRRRARAWCNARPNVWAPYWRFRVVRVRETVRALP